LLASPRNQLLTTAEQPVMAKIGYFIPKSAIYHNQNCLRQQDTWLLFDLSAGKISADGCSKGPALIRVPHGLLQVFGPCHLHFKTTKKSFQPTIVVTYISAFLVLNGHFIMF
jgi:hypothetical protein